MKQRMTLFMAILLIGIGLSNAQVSQVTGNVMSEEDGLPVVGASVLVKGTTVGTVTDIDGNFTISGVPASAKTLVVSFIGLQSQEVYGAQNETYIEGWEKKTSNLLIYKRLCNV